ncbi:putative transposase [Vibrio atlanticus]|uniref:Transposase n=1 Tax=Vibrio atlanticus (strain LGP32) TaxID=575788 RepID=B7VQZ4_VIBA3|nr:putative transposase [Vibrio atlanticus]
MVLNCTGGTMSDYSYFCGIDLAKNHFSLHAVDQNGKVILHKSVTRSKLLTTIANMPLMRIGVEACGGAHYWARTLYKLGHDDRIMAVKYVIPYRTKGKNARIIWSLLHNQTEYENYAA